MKKYSKFTLSAVAVVLALGIMGLSPNDRMVAEESGFFVSGADYNAVIQERAGYAFGLGHFVGRHHAMKDELKGWQDMVRELSSMSAPNTLIARFNGVTQERLGYAVATDHLLDVKAGLNQTVKGYETVLEHQTSMNKALRQEQIGLRYMLERMNTTG
jgi:hypothetical protein